MAYTKNKFNFQKIIFLNLAFLNLVIFLKADDADYVSIDFLIEENQMTTIRNEISPVLKVIENEENIQIKDNYITLYRDNMNETMEKFCSIIYEKQSLFIDLSYYPWDEGLEILKKSKIPYLRLDVSLNPYFKALEDYVIARMGYDAFWIFQNENDLEEAIYYMITQIVQLRLGLLNGMDNMFEQKLKKLKPTPSYYGIFASTENMNIIGEKLLQTKSLKRSDKWHFVFLDTKSDHFHNENYPEGITKIFPDKNMVCKFLKMQQGCDVPDTFSFSTAALKEAITNTVRTIKEHNIPSGSFNCKSDESSVTDAATKNLMDLSHIFTDNVLLKRKNDVITYYLNLTIAPLSESESSNNLAIWDYGRFVNLSENIKPARRFFRIGTTEAIPWSYYSRDPVTKNIILNDDGLPVWEGYCIDLIEKLSENLNFDYEIFGPKSGTFGERLSNFNWDGLIGDLISADIDIAIAALKMTSEREEVIDFIAPYFEQTGISIVIRKPVRQTSLFKFMTVLRAEVWMSIVAALVATAIMIWLLDKFSPYSAMNNKKAYPYPCREFTLKESFWFALTSFTPQGGGEAPKAVSSRVLVAAYWLFVVLMLATFTANLAAFLTVERMQTPVQSLEQLARQSRINYTVVENSETHEYFVNMKHAEDTLYRMWKELTLNATADQRKYRIWDYPIKEQYGHILLAINSSNPVKDAAEGFRQVNEHEDADYAFIHDAAEIKYELTKNCNLTEVGEVFAEQPYAIAIQQGSHIQDELSYALLELQKDRYFESLTAKFWNTSANKECSASEDTEGIDLQSLGGVFIATLFGLALAIVTLTGEVLYYRRKAIKGKLVKPINSGEMNDAVTTLSGSLFGQSVSSSPPPSFEKATFNQKKIFPERITLGSDKFKPTRLRKGDFISVRPRNPIHDEEHPPYFE